MNRLSPIHFRPAWGNLAARWFAFLAMASICATPSRADDEFPPELTNFKPGQKNPIFTGAGPGHWDEKIRERGWILRENDGWHLWYTGFLGTKDSTKYLGYATSPDGITWTRWPKNPIYRDHWVEDMMVVRSGDTYYMFAEGLNDRAQLLTSKDKVNWARVGTLDIRKADGTPIDDGPYGTPTAWLEDGKWKLFYERRDAGIWIAAPISDDLKAWKNIQDEPVMVPGPEEYDRKYIAVNQILKHKGRYYAYFHGSAANTTPSLWSSGVAVSSDLFHWKKYPGNPLQPIAENKSSDIVVHDGKQFRLYTMHPEGIVHFPVDTP